MRTYLACLQRWPATGIIQLGGSSTIWDLSSDADDSGVYLLTKSNNDPNIASGDIRLLVIVSNAKFATGNVSFGR